MPSDVRCACDACDVFLSSIEARSKDKLCDFCDDHCYPLMTMDGKKSERVRMNAETRARLHGQADGDGSVFNHPVVDKLTTEATEAAIEYGKPLVRAGVKKIFDSLFEKIRPR